MTHNRPSLSVSAFLLCTLMSVSGILPSANAQDDSMAIVENRSPLVLTFNGEARCEKGVLDIITETVEAIGKSRHRDRTSVLISLEPLVKEDSRITTQSFNLADGKQNPHLGVRFSLPEPENPLLLGVFICVTINTKEPLLCLRPGIKPKSGHALKYFNYLLLHKDKIYFSKERFHDKSYETLQDFLRQYNIPDREILINRVKDFQKLTSPPFAKRKRSLEVVLPYQDPETCK